MPGPELRWCSMGQHESPVECFPPDIKKGLKSYCRDCKNARARGEVPGAKREPKPPLQAAYEAHESAVQRRDLSAERSALLEENIRLKQSLAFARGFSEPIQPQRIAPIEAGSKSDAVACIVASDWHVEEEVEDHKVHGLNHFNLEVAEKRAQFFWRNALALTDMMARETRIETLWVGLLGDFISNYIHQELVQTNLLGPTPAMRMAQKLIISGIEFLLKESPYRLVIDCVHGNHGRMTQKPQAQHSSETSLETFMYHAIAGRYEGNPRVEFRVAEGKMLYRRVFERFNMRLIHGDDVKFWGGSGGLTIPILKSIGQWDKAIRADLTVMGHFHQFFDGQSFLVNGSLIGYNEFAQSIKASPEEAKQAFFLIHARNGGEKSVVAPIWLDDAHRQHLQKTAS